MLNFLNFVRKTKLQTSVVQKLSALDLSLCIVIVNIHIRYVTCTIINIGFGARGGGRVGAGACVLPTFWSKGGAHHFELQPLVCSEKVITLA